MPWTERGPMDERLQFVRDARSNRFTMSALCPLRGEPTDRRSQRPLDGRLQRAIPHWRQALLLSAHDRGPAHAVSPGLPGAPLHPYDDRAPRLRAGLPRARPADRPRGGNRNQRDILRNDRDATLLQGPRPPIEQRRGSESPEMPPQQAPEEGRRGGQPFHFGLRDQRGSQDRKAMGGLQQMAHESVDLRGGRPGEEVGFERGGGAGKRLRAKGARHPPASGRRPGGLTNCRTRWSGTVSEKRRHVRHRNEERLEQRNPGPVVGKRRVIESARQWEQQPLGGDEPTRNPARRATLAPKRECRAQPGQHRAAPPKAAEVSLKQPAQEPLSGAAIVMPLACLCAGRSHLSQSPTSKPGALRIRNQQS